MNWFCLLTLGLFGLVFYKTFRKVYTNTDSNIILFGYSYFFFSYACGVLNYFLFRWIFEAEMFTNNFYKAFWLWGLGFSLVSFAIYCTPVRTWSFSLKNSMRMSGDFVVAVIIYSVLIQFLAIMAYVKSGTIPLFSQEIESARSQMHTVGVLNQAFYLNILVIFLNGTLLLRWKGPLSLVSALLIFLSFGILFFYGMRNFVLVGIFGLVFLREMFYGSKLNLRKVAILTIVAVFFLSVYGMFRAQQSYEADFILLSARMFSGVFSEFREWPDIIGHSMIKASPMIFFNILCAIIPTQLLGIVGIDKSEVIFSSGLYYKDLLSRIFEGDNLGLRTSLYGDFYVMFGMFSFILLPIIFYVLLRFFTHQLTRNLMTAPFYLMALMTLFIGFSSELSTLILKLFFLFFSMVILLILTKILEGSHNENTVSNKIISS